MIEISLQKHGSDMKKNLLLFSLVGVIVTSAFLIKPTPVQAFSLGDVFIGIKDIFSGSTQSNALTVSSTIALAPGGDINHNGQITTGDTVRFSYTIINTTNNSYKFVTLKTNIYTKDLNGISNVQGAASLDQSNNTVVIPNLTINKNQVRKVSFDAQINFNKDTDQTISTQPVLVAQSGKTIATGATQSVVAAKMDTATFDKFVHITK